MKILQLEIENVRGIKKLTISPSGENIVVFGPNGSGKSAVVDAIDFLLTGEISRLMGRGTGGISLKQHGPHIDYKPKDAVVRATIKIDSVKDPINIERNMSAPKTIKCSKEIATLQDIIESASRGQYVLSRTEILKFIAAESGKRAEEILALLDLSKAEELRKTFGAIKSEAVRALQSDKLNYEKSISTISPILSLEFFSEEDALEKVNECRAILKGKALDRLSPDNLKDSIQPLAIDEVKTIDAERLNSDFSKIKAIILEKGKEVFDKEKELLESIEMVNRSTDLTRNLKHKRLLDMGISLIEEAGVCPLCLTEWRPGELKKFLKDRLLKVDEAKVLETRITTLVDDISSILFKLEGLLIYVVRTCDILKEEDALRVFKEWQKRLSEWADGLKRLLVDSKPKGGLTEEIKTLKSTETWENVFEKIIEIITGVDKVNPQQKAWDKLSELKYSLQRYFEEKKKFLKSEIFAFRATKANKIYTEYKDIILEELYDSVKDDFAEYYRFLHGVDEKDFGAELKPEGAGLALKVDFYGRGFHHPRALHSEGHQDSMGLCLYLALNKKLSANKINLIILDDVVMSIDNSHRRSICRLLNVFFPDRQFLITTHNRTWARQLKTDGIVKKPNMVEFKGWSVETGPQYEEGYDVWEKIFDDLKRNEVPSAAHKLRYHAEFYYEQVCESLRGKVPYKGDHRWDFGDFSKGAIEAYRKCLKQAKKSANSWGETERHEELMVMETISCEIFKRTQVEQWGLNANVHHSKWDDFSKEDFQPIVEAFQDLEGLFKCSSCQGLLSISLKNMEPKNITCPCGGIAWNLIVKS